MAWSAVGNINGADGANTGNFDGGNASSVYGGTTTIDGGAA